MMSLRVRKGLGFEVVVTLWAPLCLCVCGRTRLVLRMSATSAALVLYNDTDGATKLPYACKLDVALRIEGSTTSRDTGKVREKMSAGVCFSGGLCARAVCSAAPGAAGAT